MSKIELSNIMQTCANCGKGEEGSDALKSCVACKLVKYCNRDCQIAHRPQHKKACKERVAELHEEALFRDHTGEECPICFLLLPKGNEVTFKSCCGKRICDGCIHAPLYDTYGNEVDNKKCPYCRKLAPTSNEGHIERTKKLIESGNAKAIHMLGTTYMDGMYGMPQDYQKAKELYLKAAALGCVEAYHTLGILYQNGQGVERDTKKAIYYLELSAIGGDVEGRYNLALIEEHNGNYNRAYRHFILSERAGDNDSLDKVKSGFVAGHVAKDDYASTLRAYQKSRDEMRSEARDKARKEREIMKRLGLA